MHRIDQQIAVDYTYPVIFTRDVFSPANPALAEVLRPAGARQRTLVLVDAEVARLTPGLLARIATYAARQASLLDLAAPPLALPGGEACKNDPALVAQVHALIARHRLCRHAFVVAIGGGAFLDAVGYATATAHRGLRLLRLPTTVLAQNDAGVGVKNGINAYGRKNFLGTFAPPFAVVNDFAFLATLSERDQRAGIAEAIKVALVRDRAFFEFLEAQTPFLARFAPATLEWLIIRCAGLHLQHIRDGGDPFERGSGRPLDFGHWAAHALEELTAGELRHGEAVAIGIALDCLYARRQGLLPEADLGRILLLLGALGFDLTHPALARLDPPAALAAFREHLGGALAIPLLRGIGETIEVAAIDLPAMRGCIAELLALGTEEEETCDARFRPPLVVVERAARPLLS
jgi:3-dehydroquinate synthase